MFINIHERKIGYQKPHCWQYEIRRQNEQSDLSNAVSQFSRPTDLFTPAENVTIEDLRSLSVGDFTFQQEKKEFCFDEVSQFIQRHEWLGKMSLYPTHIFTARYKGLLCGAVIMDMPNAFSKLLGEDTKKIERLISRGACISFSPKNLGSAIVMFSINWMVRNTPYRLFTAYADPEAKELGTIYQACNFFYLGKNSGTAFQFKIENGKWVSDRYFRSRSVYKRLAIKCSISWVPEWQDGDRVFLDRMPSEVEAQLREASKQYIASCEKREVAPKHKYAYVQGATKGETKLLRKKFLEMNKVLPYPKERGQ